jgi:hypothetical protein
MAFGKKGLATAAVQDTGADDAIARMSQSLGQDMDFEICYVFDPSLWEKPLLARELDAAGLVAEALGNQMGLFRDAVLAARLRAAPAEDPLKRAVLEAGFGLVPFDRGKAGGFDAGKTAFQARELLAIAFSPASPAAKRAAVLNLFDWSYRVMQGEIALPMPG